MNANKFKTYGINARGFGFALLLAISIPFAFCAGCYTKPVVSKMPSTYDPAGEIMEKAERSIKTEDYETAVRMLDELLFRFPDSPEADDALMKKIGRAHV